MAFEIPTGFNCITTSGGTTLTAYKTNSRSTYTLIGFDWVETARTTGTQNYSTLVCYQGSKLIPSSVMVEFVLPATLIMLAFFGVILNMFMGVRR